MPGKQVVGPTFAMGTGSVVVTDGMGVVDSQSMCRSHLSC